MTTVTFDIQVTDGVRLPRGARAGLIKAVQAAHKQLPARYQFPVQANLLITDNQRVKKLNQDFRGMAKPTNVLSFPQYETRELLKIGRRKTPIELGDIAIAYPYVVVEAKKTNKILINHLTHLVIHGFLHLFGYDHIMDAEANRMERLEAKILADLGLPDPYTYRSPSVAMTMY